MWIEFSGTCDDNSHGTHTVGTGMIGETADHAIEWHQKLNGLVAGIWNKEMVLLLYIECFEFSAPYDLNGKIQNPRWHLMSLITVGIVV